MMFWIFVCFLIAVVALKIMLGDEYRLFLRGSADYDESHIFLSETRDYLQSEPYDLLKPDFLLDDYYFINGTFGYDPDYEP